MDETESPIHNADYAPTLAGMCSGVGGLELAVERALGARTMWQAENDPAAAAVLAARWPGVPNIGDITRINWAAVEPVSILCAGYPCQPFSSAGKGKGADDHRHLWPHVRDAIRHLRPQLVVLENVANHLRIGFKEVLGDLAALGFDAEWSLLRASDVGACHRRARLFVVAYPTGERFHERPGLRSGNEAEDGWRFAYNGGEQTPPDTESECGADIEASSYRPTLPFSTLAGTGGRTDARDLAAGADLDRRGARVMAWGVYEPAIRHHELVLGRPAPYPLDGARLSARFVEWMMMLPEGWVTDLLSRNAAIRCLGNGVVPLAAETACRILLDAEEVAA